MVKQMFTMRNEAADRHSAVSDVILFQVLTKMNYGQWCFTILELSWDCPQISCTFLYEIIIVRFSYHKFCARRVPKMLTHVHKEWLIFDFLEWYHKNGKEFLNRIIWLTGAETCVSFVNAETKEESMRWIHTHSPTELKEFEQTSACQKPDGSSFLRQGKSADGRIYAKGPQ